MIRLEQGRIGGQEAVSLVGMALYVSVVFLLDSRRSYEYGNSTYVWAPCAVLLAFLIFLLAAYAVKRAKSRNLAGLMDFVLGGAGAAVRVLFSLYLLYSAYALLAKFAAIMRSFIYIDVQVQNVLAWMLPPVALPAILGLECLGRLAKCIAMFAAVMILLGFLGPMSDFALFRMYPLMGDGGMAVLKHTVQHQFTALPAFIALLAVTQGVQGEKNMRRYGAIAAGAAGGMVLITQLVLALTYTYADLSEMFVPLYRQNMMLIDEGYFYRLDKIAAFLWLMCSFVAAAFYIYSAALLVCGEKGVRDVRPASAAMTVTVFACVLTGSSNTVFISSPVQEWIGEYGCIPFAALMLIIAGAGLIKARLLKRRGECDEKGA